MSRICECCGKKPIVGARIVRHGLKKAKGGIGLHVVKNTKRTFSPNIQNVRVVVNGQVKQMYVCTACIRSNRIVKA